MGVLKSRTVVKSELQGKSGAKIQHWMKELLVGVVDDEGFNGQVTVLEAIPAGAHNVRGCGRIVEAVTSAPGFDAMSVTPHDTENDDDILDLWGQNLGVVAGTTFGPATWAQAIDGGNATFFRQGGSLIFYFSGGSGPGGLTGGSIQLVIFYDLVTPPTKSL